MIKLLVALILAATVGVVGTTPPQEVLAPVTDVFQTADWAGWDVALVDDATRNGHPQMYAAAILQREGRNVLCVLKRFGGNTYAVVEETAPAIYQDRLPDMLSLRVEPGAPINIIVDYGYDVGDERGLEWYRAMLIEDLMVFTLTEAHAYFPQEGGWYSTSTFYRSYLLYGHSEKVLEDNRVFGFYHRWLSNFDIEDHPRTLEAARETMGPLPALAPGEQQDPLPQAVTVQAAAGAELLPRTGPGAYYAPAEDAPLPKDTQLQALGLTGHEALVAYTLPGADQARYGYLPLNALELDSPLPELVFSMQPARVLEDTALAALPGEDADAPTLAAGERVVYLATSGSDWSYVLLPGAEIGQARRGFVPSAALEVDYTLDVSADLGGGRPARMTGDADLIDDPFRRPERVTLATLEEGDMVEFLDVLYGSWAFVRMPDEEGGILGYVPFELVEAASDQGLVGNG